MIKDKLHTINDEDAEKVARLLLFTEQPYDFVFDKITRWKYDTQEGVDAEETVDVHFYGNVKNQSYHAHGWSDIYVTVKLIEKDRYHNHPYFCAYKKTEASATLTNFSISKSHRSNRILTI